MKAKRMVWAGTGIAMCLAACGDASRPVAGGDDAASPMASAAAAAESGPVTSYARATRALAENRMVSPAGDNAVEHYLAAREQAAERARAQTALAELQPYALIAAEQAIERGDAPEALRLQNLIERIDAQAPALPRLRAGVAALLAREQAAQAAATALETPRPAVPGASVAARAAQAEPEGVAMRPAAVPATMIATPEPARPPSSSPPPVGVQDEVRPANLPVVAADAARGGQAPRLLQDAQPRYPLPALRARIEGQAEVAFTIRPDGSVRDVRVLSSTPAGMFDASALAVAQRWRFEATGQEHASSRTVRFRLPAAESRDG